MPSTARSAVITFDGALIVRDMNPVAQELCGGRPWLGRALPDCLTSFARFAPGTPQPAPGAAGTALLQRYLDSGRAFTLLIGDSAWRAELTSLGGSLPPTGGVLLMHEAGAAEDYRDLPLDRIDFRAALLHDLRTPLNAMAGWVHLLNMALPDPPQPVARALAGLRRAIDRQRDLIAEQAEPTVAAPSRTQAARHAPPQAHSTTDAGAPPGTGETGLGGCHVLAVDDNPELLDVLSALLTTEGAIVCTAESADQVLDRYPVWAARGGERVLISDLAMPGRDGLSLIREIRALERRHRLPRLPAVALSAHGIPEIRRKAIENGFDLFLDKPIDPPVLLRQLGRLVDRC